ncbi:hypothetical protein MNB_SV-3-1345 [hydrothermal vent metagenome]|uniref:Lipoprotein n=1 Tax=hydrothermal vent metagenome TaxID=652676 RepID=A0A1W1BTW8_9ZZZZ
MKYILLTFFLLFSFSGCNDEKEQTGKDTLLAELKAKNEDLRKTQLEVKKIQDKLAKQAQNNKFSKVGITIQENTITIDTNKTKDFFQNIGKKLQKFTHSMKEGIVHEKDAGIRIEKTHIDIDLNKTKSFLGAWGEKIQSYAKEIDKMIKKITIPENKEKE